MRRINCGFRCLKGSLFFSEFVSSIVNPVNKLYFLAYKVQQTFFVPAIKTGISEQHDTSFLLTKYYSYGNVFYLVKMRNLSRNGSGQWAQLLEAWFRSAQRPIFQIRFISFPNNKLAPLKRFMVNN